MMASFLAAHPTIKPSLEAATTKVVSARSQDPLGELAKCLVDAAYEPKMEEASTGAAEYAHATTIQSAIAQALRQLVKAPPSADEALAVLAKSIGSYEGEMANADAAANLSKGLEMRPTAEQLKQAGILKSQAEGKKVELEKAMAADVLNKHLAKRPSTTQLQENGIIKSPMEDNKGQLEKAMAADALGKSLAKRPTVAQLEEQGILEVQ